MLEGTNEQHQRKVGLGVVYCGYLWQEVREAVLKHGQMK